MEVKLSKDDPFLISTDVVWFGVFEKEKSKEVKKADALLGGAVSDLMKQENFKGKYGEILTVQTQRKCEPKKLIVAGFGKKEECTVEKIRRISAKITKMVKKNAASIATNFFTSFKEQEKYVAGIIEGFFLANYSFTKFKTKENEKDKLQTLFLLSAEKRLEQMIRMARAVSSAALLARDMANQPANFATPTAVSKIAQELARKNKFTCRVLDRKEIEKERMGGLLGVAQGSFQEPKFVILDYTGKRDSPIVVLVGKGITFDSGGISIKPSQAMDEMKFDKCGAIVVLSLFTALAQLQIPLRVVGLLPLTENLPGGKAMKPGDIVTISNGKTVEVLNTDAEGRLILADALAYAGRYKPEVVIDLATLTGACIIALGDVAAGLMTPSDKLAEALEHAGKETGELLWRLPLFEEYSKDMESAIADLRNLGSMGKAGTCTAGAFLKEFVECKEWAHLDIAGVSWVASSPKYLADYVVAGATGYGVRLLAHFLLNYKK